ncbi:MAG: DnaD domain protein [Clostridia bacterium]|nr:DnaD domain protein [Clostridia bacterium]
MDFRKQNITNYNLYDTAVDNMFIAEFMATAPGDYVKVYLLALMHANLSIPCTNEELSKQLSVSLEEILLCWNYWEKLGLIRKHYPDSEKKLRYTVEFLNIREVRFGKRQDAVSRGKAAVNLTDEDLGQLYRDIEVVTGRLFEGKEVEEIACWISDYNISPDVILYCYKYCMRNSKTNKYRYVGTVLRDWNQKGYKTVSDVENYLAETDNRHFLYKRILKALGFIRNSTEEERRIIDTWFDDMGFDIERVLEACKKTSGISNPNINYINSVLSAWKKEISGDFGKTTEENFFKKVMSFYEIDREENERKTMDNRELVFNKVPRIREIIEELRETNYSLSKAMLMGENGSSALAREKRTINQLNEEKNRLLEENGFSKDQLDMVYTCKLCKDMGMLEDGERCSCFNDKMEYLLNTEENQATR